MTEKTGLAAEALPQLLKTLDGSNAVGSVKLTDGLSFTLIFCTGAEDVQPLTSVTINETGTDCVAHPNTLKTKLGSAFGDVPNVPKDQEYVYGGVPPVTVESNATFEPEQIVPDALWVKLTCGRDLTTIDTLWFTCVTTLPSVTLTNK